jgi:leucyl-tRNA---protein transferase
LHFTFATQTLSALLFYHDRISPESISGPQLDHVLALGWYRTHQSIFTTSHVELGEQYRVHWLRFPLPEIKESSSSRRIRNKNKSFQVVIEDFETIRPDHQELHRRYRDSINFDGAVSIQDCLFGQAGTDKNIFTTKCISILDEDVLVAGGYFDVGKISAASILHFFDPEYKRFSLGKYLILVTIDYLRQHGFVFYYPGYVVEGLSKMDYKLFLGRKAARYFDAETLKWKYFDERILSGSE